MSTLKLVLTDPSVEYRKWLFFYSYIRQSLPEHLKEDAFTEGHLYKAFLEKKLFVWVAFLDDRLVGVMSGIVSSDALTRQSAFIIYSISFEKGLTLTNFKEGISQLEEFAKYKGCKRLHAYTFDKMALLAKHLGFESRAFITKEIE